MPMLACGFEAASLDFYRDAGWVVNGVALGSKFVHRDANGFGGNYAVFALGSAPLRTPYLTDSANTRWVHFWLHRGLEVTWANGFPVIFMTSERNQFTVRINSDGFIQLRRGGATGTIVATSSGSLDMSVGHWFAIEMVIANSGGVCNVYVDDGALFVGYTGDTQNTNTYPPFTGNWTSVTWANVSDASGWIDDIIITDNTDGQITETYGQRAVPASDEASGLTPSTGSTNYLNILDYDTSRYNAGTTATTEDLYGVEGNLPLGTVDWVGVHALVASQNGFEMQTALKSGATTAYGTLRQGGPSSYLAAGSLLTFHTTDPDTATAWTAAGVNALQAGVRTGS